MVANDAQSCHAPGLSRIAEKLAYTWSVAACFVPERSRIAIVVEHTVTFPSPSVSLA